MRFAIRCTPLLSASTLLFTACRDDASTLTRVTAPEAPSYSKNESEAATGVFHRYRLFHKCADSPSRERCARGTRDATFAVY